MAESQLTHDQEMHVESHAPYLKVWVGLLMLALRRWRRDPRWVALYALCPAAVFEFPHDLRLPEAAHQPRHEPAQGD